MEQPGLLFYVCSALLLAGCGLFGSKDEEEKTWSCPADVRRPTSITSSLVGEWEWVCTTYYFTTTGEPVVETPEEGGYSLSVTLDEEGFISYFLDGTPSSMERFWVLSTNPGILSFEDSLDGVKVYVGADAEWLRIDMDRMDRGEHLYRRVPAP